uniref:Reverse transcriptase Ty1/copia-type domain-containing protein n=1 Tax=Fagus sylvatica TaxID=28930 RepID=A0A2N9HFY3_FAGSY
MEQQHHLSIDSGPPVEDPAQYRCLVGHLIYLIITRPDITYSMHILSPFMHDPRQGHLYAAIRVLSCLMTHCSITGYFTQLGSSLLSWKTKKYVIVSHSLVEAKYRSMAATTSELLWLRNLLHTLGIPHP